MRSTVPNINFGHFPNMAHQITVSGIPMYHQHPQLPVMNFQHGMPMYHMGHPYMNIPHFGPLPDLKRQLKKKEPIPIKLIEFAKTVI